MARKRYSDEDCLKLLRGIEVQLASGSDVRSACRAMGISDATYYSWRKKFGSMGRSQLAGHCHVYSCAAQKCTASPCFTPQQSWHPTYP